MHTSRILAAVGAITLAVTLTACGTDTAPAGDPATLSPIDEYLAYAWGGQLSPEEQQARWTEQQRRTEAYVADCMKREGFEYTPNVPQDIGIAPEPGGGEDSYDPESERWVSQYGYGIVVSPWGNIAIDPMPKLAPGGGTDPNGDYVASLSETEQAAYFAALYGPGPTEEEIESGEYEYTWENSGCNGAAQHELGIRNVQQDAEFQPLMEAIDAFRSTLWDDAAFATLDGRWSSCMADAGHPGFAAQQDAAASIGTAYSELWTAAGDGGLEPKDPAVLELGEQEIVLALADLRCRDEVDYLASRQRIQFDLERAFVKEHEAEFETFKAAAEQAS